MKEEHILLIESFIKEIRKEERERCMREIDKKIKPGILKGYGMDDTAERNGLILAKNVIFAMSN